VKPSYQPDLDSQQDMYEEYSSMVRASYDKLFEALLKADPESDIPVPPPQPA
jgi:hypothetical protein